MRSLAFAVLVLAAAPGCRDSARVAKLEQEIAERIAERERVADLAERLDHSKLLVIERTEALGQVQAKFGRGTPPKEGLAHLKEHRKDLRVSDRGASGFRIEGTGAPAAATRALEVLAHEAPGLPVLRADIGAKSWSLDVPPDDTPPVLESVLPPFKPDPAKAIRFPHRDLAPRSVRYLEKERSTLDKEIAELTRPSVETERFYARAKELEAKLALLVRADRLRHVADAATRLFGEKGSPLVSGSLDPDGPLILFTGGPRKKDPDVRGAVGTGWDLSAIAGTEAEISGTILLREEK